MEVNGNEEEVSGLAANTSYQWRVRSICTDERSDFSAINTFTTEPHGDCDEDEDCFDVRLDIRLDDYGSETSWELIDENGDVVEEGGSYQDSSDGTMVGDDFCLPDGCYSLVVYDDAGDGLCCYYGSGEFWLSDADGDAFYTDDGSFGDYVVVDFCVSDDELGRARIDNLVAKPKAVDPVKAEQARVRKQK
jgi:hypothetical protein